jgi:hypothetical protein
VVVDSRRRCWKVLNKGLELLLAVWGGRNGYRKGVNVPCMLEHLGGMFLQVRRLFWSQHLFSGTKF